LAAGLPFGATGVAIAYTLTTFSLFVPALVYSGRPMGIGAGDVLSATAPQMAAAMVAVALGLTIRQVFLLDSSEVTRLIVSIPVCATTYLAIVLGVFRLTGPLKLASSLLRDFAPLKRRA
jgi:PST family polysaccharide transporter